MCCPILESVNIERKLAFYGAFDRLLGDDFLVFLCPMNLMAKENLYIFALLRNKINKKI